ncbi:MAG: ABC transporter substrate-binding protein [Intestinimonas sp.]|jgi:peptide/nickel transport system substrate-binding protein|nr:ABC transporter substrate-binding protein [Intestinimonas sp.]
MKKQILALFLSATVLGGALCACGGTSSGAGKTSGSPAVTPAGSDENSSSGEIVTGGEITVGISQDLDESLDPYQITAAGTREVLFNVYEGLVKPNSEGDFVSAVASDYSVSDDGLTYTFVLRDGVKFHNGETVTTDDVIYSFNTCAATSVDSALVAALSAVTDVSAPDAHTVKVTLSAPNPDFISYVAYVYIVPADYTDNATQPVGTGPFQFISRSVQENVVLEKFADYYGTPAYLDKVTYKIYEDATAVMTALNAGSVDLYAHLTLSQEQGLPKEYNVLEGTMNLVQALYLNNAADPFNNEKVRQALCYAVDVDGLMSLTADGHGTRVGSSMYPAFTKYFDPSLSTYYTCDTTKAKQLLTEAGYPDGFTFTIKVPSNYTPHVDAAQVLVEQLKAVGVTANIQEVDWNTWLSDVYQNRDFEATVIGFDASTLTASAMLERWTSTSSKNMINYSNSEYDQTFAAARASTDDSQQTELYKKCERILTETAANVYIQDLADFVVLKTDLDGFKFYPLYVIDLSAIHYVK